MDVTVIGAGNAGYSHSFKISERGHSVRLLKTSHSMHDDSFRTIQKNEGIWAIDNTDGGKRKYQKIDLITRDFENAIKGADIVFILVQSLQHENLAPKVVPHLEDNQIVIVAPGYMGSLYFKKKCKKDVIFCEGESLPFDARIVEAGTVNILFKNRRNPLSFIPKRSEKIGFGKVNQLLDDFYTRNSILESALHNPNLIVHTVGTIMSAARIEHSNGEFWMYREAFTKSTWNVVHDLDNEKMKILNAFNLPEQSFADSFQFRTNEDLEKDSLEAFNDYAYSGSPKGPDVVNHRYIYEDVPMGLCLMSSFGKKFDIPTPVCDSLITIASSLLNTNFWLEGRTLDRLGIGSMTKDEIIEYLSM